MSVAGDSCLKMLMDGDGGCGGLQDLMICDCGCCGGAEAGFESALAGSVTSVHILILVIRYWVVSGDTTW